MKTIAVTKARIKTRKSELNEPIRVRGRFCVCSVSSVSSVSSVWSSGKAGVPSDRSHLMRQNPIAAKPPLAKCDAVSCRSSQLLST